MKWLLFSIVAITNVQCFSNGKKIYEGPAELKTYEPNEQIDHVDSKTWGIWGKNGVTGESHYFEYWLPEKVCIVVTKKEK